MTSLQLNAALSALLTQAPESLGLCSELTVTHIPLNDAKVAAAVRPPAHGSPTLVFMHGWQDNLASFHSLIPLLPQNMGLILFDWPGHGLSDHKLGDYYYPFFDYLDDLHQVLNDSRLLLSGHVGPVVLVGHSLGGLVASCYAASFPDRIDAIVSIEALGRWLNLSCNH